MKAKPLITASAIFFFLWATMAVTLASHGLIRSRSIIFLLSVISLAGSVQLLRAIRRESPRWYWGIPFAAVCMVLALWTGVLAWAVPYHLADPAFPDHVPPPSRTAAGRGCGYRPSSSQPSASSRSSWHWVRSWMSPPCPHRASWSLPAPYTVSSSCRSSGCSLSWRGRLADDPRRHRRVPWTHRR